MIARVAKGAGIYTIGLGISKVLLLAIQLLLARRLGMSGYGLYHLGWSSLLLLQSFALLGLDQGVLRFGAVYRTHDNSESVKGSLAASLLLSLLSSLLVTGAILIAAGPIAKTFFHTPAFAPLLCWFALALPFLAISRVTGAFVQSHHDILRMTLIQQICQPGMDLLLVLVVFALGGGLRGAVEALLFSAIFTALVGLYSVRQVFPQFFASLKPEFHWSELLRYSLAVSAAFVLYQVFWRAPSLMLGHLGTAAEVGLYSAAATLSSPPGFISMIFAQPFMPAMVDLCEHGRTDDLAHLYQTVTRWTYMVVIPGFGFLILFRHQFLALFGQDFRAGASILVCLSSAWMVYYAKGPVSALLDMTGRQKLDALNQAGVAALSLALGWWLIPIAGAEGLGWALGISILAWSACEAAEAWILYGLFPLRAHFVRQLLIGLASFAVGDFLHVHAGVLAGALAGAGAYLALTLCFGLPRDDRDLLHRGWQRVLLREDAT